MTRSIIVITGLPASDKTTLARLLGEELGFVVIDKDDFLETLLGSVQEFDAAFRCRCSREADKHFEEDRLRGSFGFGSLIKVSTQAIVDVKKLAQEVRQLA